jgi:sedoheptulokinase
MTDIVLGIDIGTSKIASLICTKQKEILSCSRVSHHSTSSKTPGDFAEQDPKVILEAVKESIRLLDKKYLTQVQEIGFTGQMHGVLLWNCQYNKTSKLVTWEDGRCNEASVKEYFRSLDLDSLKSGFGIATLGWYAKFQPEIFSLYNAAGTIQDYLYWHFAGGGAPIIDPTDAASWGCFSVKECKWNLEGVQRLRIPETVLPSIFPSAKRLATLSKEYTSLFGMSSNVKLKIPFGDNQASLYATVNSEQEDISLTLGTGGQLSIVVDSYPQNLDTSQELIEIRPYLNGKYIIVAAALCGGSAIRWVAETIQKIASAFSAAKIPLEDIYTYLTSIDYNPINNGLKISPSFLGERFNTDLKGSISNITLTNFTTENLLFATGIGVIQSLKERVPSPLLENRKRVVVSGNSIRKFKFFEKIIAEEFSMPVMILPEVEEAALGHCF